MSKEGVKMNGREINKVSSTRPPLKSLKAEDTQEETPIIGSKRQRTPDTVNEAKTTKCDNNVVGSKVKVWSPRYERFYEGVVASFDYVKKEHEDAEVEHECHDTSSDAQRKKKKEGNTDSEASKNSKLKDTTTKSGVESKDDGKPESEIKVNNSDPRRNYADDAAVKPQEFKGKSQGDSGKPSGGNRSKDDSAKTQSHVTKQDSQRSSSNSKGKTPTKTSPSPKAKESEKSLAKTTASSSSKGGEGNNSIWATEGTPLPQATQSTLRCLSRMLNECIQTDVTIITSDGSLKAHKSILSIRSPVFRSMFQDEMSEKVSTVKIKEMTSESCMAFLSFLYGSLNQEAFLRHRSDLLGAASKYDILDLRDACEQSLLEDINSGNVLKRLQKAWVYRLDKLKKGCFTYLVDSRKIYDVRVVETNEFFRRADRRLLEETFQEVLAVWKRS